MKWYKLYLESQAISDFRPSRTSTVSGFAPLRELVTYVLARRDAAANLLRSREEFYAELKRLSAVSSLTTVTIKQVDYKQAIWLIKALRQLAQDAVVPFPSGLKECKDIYDQVVAGNPYTFKVRPQHRDAIVAKLRGAGAMVE